MLKYCNNVTRFFGGSGFSLLNMCLIRSKVSSSLLDETSQKPCKMRLLALLQI